MTTLKDEPLGLELTVESPEPWERRVSGLPPRELRDPARTIFIIVQVVRPGYVPRGIGVRTQTTANVFTAETTWRELAALASDPLVVSVALTERIAPV
jgi:hypothetical protein